MDEDQDSPSSPSDEPQDLSATGRHYAYTSDDELDSEDSGSPDEKRAKFEDNNNIEGYDLSSKREFLASLELERSPEFEEEQDCFVEDFRRMKAKGEFTCRLCTSVFPNLRSLKSHNRVHLTGPLYQCNLCPYSSRDRSILIHHMRSHNGDRPFECSICKFAFTTKANCERHLRNRHHGGVTKEASTQMDVPMDLSLKKKRQSDDEEEPERSKPPPELLYAPPYLAYPYFIPPPLLYQNLHQQKEFFRGLQLTGGRLVETNNNNNTNFNNNNNNNNNNTVVNNNKKEEVKMVIKNGVLVPKQKQRRYRTERPFGCDHCAARFTLRSNMERHIKQQHPEFWSQRQRGGGRKSHRELKAEPKEIPHGVKAAIVEQIKIKEEKRDGDLASVSKLLDAASAQNFTQFFDRQDDEDDDEEGLVASTSEHSSEERSSPSHQPANDNPTPVKKKSAYSLAPNRVSCPYCSREFPWSSSLRRHILTHTGQKPYKCDSCPLLFTTKSNCDRHSLRKHGGVRKSSGSAAEAKADAPLDSAPSARSSPGLTIVPLSLLQSPVLEEKRKVKEETPGSSELPFKCHLCDSAFAERQDTLDHLKTVHPHEYASLVAKGALESASETEETELTVNTSQHDSPKDQSNRKVICAFCLRRFWSAEDLRRHMRTHTGERPFSCELCSRRFTLKHSMLRHKKKHKATAPPVKLTVSPAPPPPANPADSLTPSSDGSPHSLSPPTGKGDLISNLLGIKDSRLVDSMLESTAKDAAKLLGIDKT